MASDLLSSLLIDAKLSQENTWSRTSKHTDSGSLQSSKIVPVCGKNDFLQAEQKIALDAGCVLAALGHLGAVAS